LSEVALEFDDEEVVEPDTIEALVEARADLIERCKAAGLAYVESIGPDDQPSISVNFKNGRHTRPVVFSSVTSIKYLLGQPFEHFTFLGDFEAICDYSAGIIEAGIRQVGNVVYGPRLLFKRLTTIDTDQFDISTARIAIQPPMDGLPTIEISRGSETFFAITRHYQRQRLTIKLSGCHIKTHDAALEILTQLTGSVLFQIDLLTNISFVIERSRRQIYRRRPLMSLSAALEYPKTQFEKAPLALYSYARSAVGMPLLQFLAFYQVMEYYFPLYSESEAHRKLKALLKDPTFRINRDSDIARVLTVIQTSRAGSFGDERTQLRSTISECLDDESIREFIELNPERKEYFQGKPKSPYHKLPVATPTADLRSDVAQRIYDIRCKIVHTKNDSRDASVELLLPFTPEAEQLFHDIELVQFVAQKVLIAGGSPLNLYA